MKLGELVGRREEKRGAGGRRKNSGIYLVFIVKIKADHYCCDLSVMEVGNFLVRVGSKSDKALNDI
jgi:hypothetical protein